MKVLIVNAHPPTPIGKVMFAEFVKTVKQSFLSNKKVIIGEVEYAIKCKDDIDDYLYEVGSEFMN